MAKGLGRGLSSLISEKVPVVSHVQPAQAVSNRDNLPVKSIKPGQFQPRTFFDAEGLDELAESIRKSGVVQPIIVRKNNLDEYEIIAGERRWRAVKMCGFTEIPAIIMDLDDQRAMEIALVENVQRQNLLPLEEADGYKRLVDNFGYTQEELSKVIGKSRSQIANLMRLLHLPDEVKQMLNEKKITVGHARAIIGIENAVELAKKIVKSGLNVRQIENLVKKQTELSTAPSIKKVKDPELAQLEEELRKSLKLDLSITGLNDRGKITIAYHSLEELHEILKRLER